MLEKIKSLNPHIEVLSVYDNAFANYGKVVEGYDFKGLIKIMENKAIPEEGNVYVAKDDDLMQDKIASALSDIFYAHMPIQIGYCNGNSFMLNALEYHKGSEIDIAVTDMVLLLGDVRDIHHNHLDSKTVKAFYVPAGTACELYATTLHYAPCKLSDSGYKSIVILPDTTNAALASRPAPLCEEDELLWAQNKWLIAHPESSKAKDGAVAGIDGDNIQIFYK